jgi:hypothetical protein
MYDLDADPSELHNVAGDPKYKDAQQTLMAVLQEKLITDYDYVPPVIQEAMPRPNAAKKKGNAPARPK